MGTTIFPLTNGGPDEDESPLFPSVTGRGSYHEENVRLQESNRRKKSPKQIIKEAEGVFNPKHSKPGKTKMGPKPKNLRTSTKKHGSFGEHYEAARGSEGKGVRVAESNRGQKMYEAFVRKYLRMGKKKNVAESRARRKMESMGRRHL